MTKNIKLSPDQLRDVFAQMLEFYTADFNDNKLSSPHYEHITVGSDYLKIGFIPFNDNTPTSMNIKIVHKGKVNDK